MSAWIGIAITAGILLVGIAAVVGVRAAFQTNKTTQTITNYEKSLASWTARAQAAEADLATAKLDLTASQAAKSALDDKYAVLQDVTSGASAVTRLGEEIQIRFDEMTGHVQILETLLQKLDPKIRAGMAREPKSGAAHE